MNTTFESVFAERLAGFLEQKRALGHPHNNRATMNTQSVHDVDFAFADGGGNQDGNNWNPAVFLLS